MPPKPPLFGIRVHPVVATLVALVLIVIAVLICMAANPNFMRGANPFGQSPFENVTP